MGDFKNRGGPSNGGMILKWGGQWGLIPLYRLSVLTTMTSVSMLN